MTVIVRNDFNFNAVVQVQALLKVRWGKKGEGREPEDLGEAKIHLTVLELAGFVTSDLTVSWGNKNRS